MSKDSIKNEIYQLIELRTEGDHWDFKQQWHENKAELVHDIICFANNLVNRDAYIIIGVTDSKSPNGTQIIGVQEDNRKSQQNVIDLLRTIKFVGGVRPTVYIHTIQHNVNVEIDVIVVKNTTNTPYFLSEQYDAGRVHLRAGHIYTRIGDTNTPIDALADMDKIEYLWRKRFGIDLSINEKILMLLDNPDEWEGNFGSENEMYHRIYPEFQIRISEEENDNRSRERNSITRNISDHFPDREVAVYGLEIIYHSTRIYEDDILVLDGARHMIPFPNSDSVYLDANYASKQKRSLTYQYYDFSTIKGKLFHNLVHLDNRWYGEPWYRCEGSMFLEFNDGQDKARFDEFVKENLEALLRDYPEALKAKGYKRSPNTEEYYIFGWSKGNEIKAHYLFDKYRGIDHKTISDYIFSPPSDSSETI